MVTILRNTEKMLQDNKSELIKNKSGELREMLELIWTEYIQNGNKNVTFPITMSSNEYKLKKMGYKCSVGVKNGKVVFYVSWE